MMIRTLFILVLSVLIAVPGLVRAQDLPVIQEAKEFANPNIQWDRNSLSGGINFRLSEPRGSQTLVQGQIDTDSFCGFNFNALFNVNIKAIIETIPALFEDLLAAYVFAFVCENFPVLCDVFKDARQYVNFTLRSSRASCQRIIALGRAAGVAARGEAEAACVQRVMKEFGDPDLAVNQCTQDPGSAAGPCGIEMGSGSDTESADILQVLAEAAGMPQFWQDMLGEIAGLEVSVSSSLFSQSRRRQPDFELLMYDKLQNKIIDEIQTRLEVYELGGEPLPIQAPGQPVPNDVLLAMRYMHKSQQEFWIAKLAGALALGEAQWTIDQLQAQLRDAADVCDLPESQQKEVDDLVERLEMGTERLETMKRIYDANLLPVVAALQDFREEREQDAGQTIRRARNTEPQPSHVPETGQQPMGWGQ